jgi:hypothetical protein
MPTRKPTLAAHRQGTVNALPRPGTTPGIPAPSPSGTTERPDLNTLLGEFSDALSLLAVAHGSLASKELRGTGDEEVAIRHALGALKGIYRDLDRASGSLARQ